MKAIGKDVLPPAQPSARADLAIPVGGESPRLPRDYAIGQLGVGTGRPSSYAQAVEFLSAAAAGKSTADSFARNGEREASVLKEKIASLGAAPSVRVGNPADEPEGGVSYLVRFYGKGSSLSGELSLIPGKEGKWLVDSLTLDSDTLDAGKKNSGTASDFDPLLYKRFL